MTTRQATAVSLVNLFQCLSLAFAVERRVSGLKAKTASCCASGMNTVRLESVKRFRCQSLIKKK